MSNTPKIANIRKNNQSGTTKTLILAALYVHREGLSDKDLTDEINRLDQTITLTVLNDMFGIDAMVSADMFKQNAAKFRRRYDTQLDGYRKGKWRPTDELTKVYPPYDKPAAKRPIAKRSSVSPAPAAK